MKISFISSANNKDIETKHYSLIKQMVEELILSKNVEVLTGGSTGIPGEIIKECKKRGIKTLCYSPDPDIDSHNSRHDNLKHELFDKIEHHNGFTERSLKMINNSDLIIVMHGRMGTLSEYCIALEEGIQTIVIKGSGGISDHLEDITRKTNKRFIKEPIFIEDPRDLAKYMNQKDPR